MKPLKPQHEVFCRHFAECANATLAAKIAGYAPGTARNAGYRLLRRPEIVARIGELHRELAAQCREVEILLGKLEAVYRRAIDNQQCSAAARVVELQAKLGVINANTSGGGGTTPAVSSPAVSPSRDEP